MLELTENKFIYHIYLMPGMAASKSIFEYIKLPDDLFVLHFLEWKIPFKGESLLEYAERMSKDIKHDNVVLLGVSFGGILVQEMSRFVKTKKVIVVSSVLHQNDYPFRLKIAKKLKVYNYLPTRILSDIDKLAKYVFGETAKDRIELYKKYLSVNDKRYLDWAIKELLNWQQSQKLSNVIYIHGKKDKVFPVKNINEKFIELKDGTHIMIINKYKWFNENLPKLITA